MKANNDGAPNLLKAARKRLGLTQVQTARRIGVAQSAISGYEKGDRVPRERVAIKMQRKLGIPASAWR